jgi:hypothetical protein
MTPLVLVAMAVAIIGVVVLVISAALWAVQSLI